MSERAWFGAMFCLGLVGAISVGVARLDLEPLLARLEVSNSAEPERNSVGGSKRTRHAALTPSSKSIVSPVTVVPHVVRRVGRARILAHREPPRIVVLRGPMSAYVPGRHGPRIIRIDPPPHRR